MKNLKLVTILLTLLLVNQNSFAQKESGGTVGGGDALAARKLIISDWFKTLKSDLKNRLTQLELNSIHDSGGRKIISDISTKGLNEDIDFSEYQLSEACADDIGTLHAASTQIGVRNAKICFDLDEIAKQNSNHEEILGLALHEHAHHFGYLDNADSIKLISIFTAVHKTTKSYSKKSIKHENCRLYGAFNSNEVNQILENKGYRFYIASEPEANTLILDITNNSEIFDSSFWSLSCSAQYEVWSKFTDYASIERYDGKNYFSIANADTSYRACQQSGGVGKANRSIKRVLKKLPDCEIQ